MRRSLLLAALVAVAAFALVTGDATVLTALPVLGLFALLASGTFVGEAAYVRRLARRSVRRRRVLAVAGRTRVVVQPRGSALLGRSLARRGPPASLAPAAA